MKKLMFAAATVATGLAFGASADCAWCNEITQELADTGYVYDVKLVGKTTAPKQTKDTTIQCYECGKETNAGYYVRVPAALQIKGYIVTCGACEDALQTLESSKVGGQPDNVVASCCANIGVLKQAQAFWMEKPHKRPISLKSNTGLYVNGHFKNAIERNVILKELGTLAAMPDANGSYEDFGLNFANVIGLKRGDAEACGWFEGIAWATKTESLDQYFDVMWAGLGKFDVKNRLFKSISGTFAGVLSEAVDCEKVGGYFMCCDLEVIISSGVYAGDWDKKRNDTFAVNDYTDATSEGYMPFVTGWLTDITGAGHTENPTVAYGNITIKYNSSASSKLRKSATVPKLPAYAEWRETVKIEIDKTVTPNVKQGKYVR